MNGEFEVTAEYVCVGGGLFFTPDKNKTKKADRSCEKSKMIVYTYYMITPHYLVWSGSVLDSLYNTKSWERRFMSTSVPPSHSFKHFIIQCHHRRVFPGRFGGFFIPLAPQNFVSRAFPVLLAHLCMHACMHVCTLLLLQRG